MTEPSVASNGDAGAQPWRAVANLADPDVSCRVRAGLGSLGLEVTVVDRCLDAVDCADGAPTIGAFDTSCPDWLGEVARLTEACPNLHPLLVADFECAEQMVSALVAGVAGFCSPTASEEAFARTANSMIECGVSIPRPYAAPLVNEIRRGRGRRVRTDGGEVAITDREWEILQMLVQRRTTREIADALFVSVGTVRSHVSSLLTKLGAADREQAIEMAANGAGRLTRALVADNPRCDGVGRAR